MRTFLQGLTALFLCVSSVAAETVPVPEPKPCRVYYDQAAVMEVVKSLPGTKAVYRYGMLVLGVHENGMGIVVGPTAKGCTHMVKISPATVQKILQKLQGA